MRGFFFIVGTGRSGTNICQQMLNLHSEIKAVTETHFIPTLLKLFGKDKITFGEFFSVIDEHYTSDGLKKWTHNHVEAGGRKLKTFRQDFEVFCSKMDCGTIREFVEAFFRFCYGHGSYLLGDKTPIYGMYMCKILELWPNAKFIHLIRDGRYSATSIKKHYGFIRLINAGFPDNVKEYSYKAVQASYSTKPVSLLDCIRYWQRVVTVIRQESEKIPTDAYLEVRYEDLILQPKSELRKIAAFLGVPAAKNWLKKGCMVPRPLCIWKQRQRIKSTEYDALTAEVITTLKDFRYSTTPYRSAQFSHLIDGLKEFVNSIRYNMNSAGVTRIVSKLRRDLALINTEPSIMNKRDS